MKRKFGQASLEYKDGVAVRASFTPTWKIDFTEVFLSQLLHIPSQDNTEALQLNADLTLAGWFNTLTDIELAERDELEMISEIVQCEKDKDGNIELCVLDYYVKTKE